jgi:hypothetical protein
MSISYCHVSAYSTMPRMYFLLQYTIRAASFIVVSRKFYYFAATQLSSVVERAIIITMAG